MKAGTMQLFMIPITQNYQGAPFAPNHGDANHGDASEFFPSSSYFYLFVLSKINGVA